MTLTLIMTACASRKEAEKISERLLKGRLAACTKLSSVESSYWWNGKVERGKETLLTILTKKKNSGKVSSAIKKVHSYEVPEIIEVPVRKGDKGYVRWACDVID